MGSFIGSESDNEICQVLNLRFSDQPDPSSPGQTYIQVLRGFFNNVENLFDAKHHLHRVFYRLATSVTGGTEVPTDPRSRKRWLHILNGNLPPKTEQAIRAVLSAVLAPNPGIDYVTFLTRHVATVSKAFELFPQNSGAPDLYTDANGKTYCQLALECYADAKLADAPNETDPPNSDGNVEKPIPDFKKGPTKKPPRKSSSKKASVKRSTARKSPAKNSSRKKAKARSKK